MPTGRRVARSVAMRDRHEGDAGRSGHQGDDDPLFEPIENTVEHSSSLACEPGLGLLLVARPAVGLAAQSDGVKPEAL